MANETLSPKQAKQVMTQYESIINDAVKKMDKAFDEFFVTVGNEWEDQYAIEFSKNIRESMNEVTKHLDENSKKFEETIVNIAKAYAKVGGMAVSLAVSFSIPGLVISAANNVKDTFDGDMFGFKEVESPERVSEALARLQSTLESVVSETNSRLRSINAFGNEQVMQNLSISAGRIIEILQGSVKEVENIAKKNIKNAADAYASTGKSAVDAANIQKG